MRDVLKVNFQKEGLAIITSLMYSNSIEFFMFFSNQIMSTTFSFITKLIGFSEMKEYFDRAKYTEEKLNDKNNPISFVYEFPKLIYFEDMNLFFLIVN